MVQRYLQPPYTQEPGRPDAALEAGLQSLGAWAHEELHKVISQKNLADARVFFEEAFWQKSGFKPTALHLCHALERQDPAMVRLLAVYGAPLPEQEALMIMKLLAQRRVDAKTLLRRTGLALPEGGAVDNNAFAAFTEMLARKNILQDLSALKAGKLAMAAFNEMASKKVSARAIVDEIFAKMKDDIVPPAATETLALLKAAGTDFSTVNPCKYLGHKAPGLAKTLLDMGLIAATSFDIVRLRKKVRGVADLTLERADKNYPYTAFICQVLLESDKPELYTAMRAQINPDYLKAFEDVMKNKGSYPELSYQQKKPVS